MFIYVIKRILSMIPVLFGITIICFLVIHLAPGSPTDVMTSLNIKISFEARQKLEKLYGLDKPLHIQYWNWFKRFVRFDFGKSFLDGRSVTAKIKERIPVTLMINVLSLFFIFCIAVPIGVYSAVKEGQLADHAMTVFVFIGFAMPSFWLALILMSYFGVELGWVPISGLESLGADQFPFFKRLLDRAWHLILPVFVSGFGGLAGLSRYVRTSMVGVLNQDYIRTARAKGLSENTVIFKHAVRNALLPVVTILGLSIPGLIGGSVIFETIFGIPGMGRLFYESVMSRDYPVVMGILVIGAVLTLIGNFMADIAYAYVDPRIRRGKL